jgi:hypothetical protein
MTQPTVSRRKGLIYHGFDPMLADVKRLSEQGYNRAGRWSLGMACDHVAMSIRMPFEAGTIKPFPRPVRVVLRWTVLPWLLAGRIPAGVPAPPELQPADANDDAAGLARLLDAVRFAASAAGDTVDHPVFGALSRDRNDRLQLRHAAHHFSFLVPTST